MKKMYAQKKFTALLMAGIHLWLSLVNSAIHGTFHFSGIRLPY